MRNEPRPLDRQQASRAYALQAALEACQSKGENVRMRYYRRDQQQGEVKGEVRYFSGKEGMDTMSVTIRDETKGDRTINLCRVLRASKA